MNPIDWPFWLFIPACWILLIGAALLGAYLDDSGRSE